jgi:integrase
VLLQQLTPLQVERCYTERGVTLVASGVAVHHAILTSALNAAVNRGLLRANVAKCATNKPRGRMSEDVLHNVWNADEAHRFLTTVKQEQNAQYAAFFALALNTGLQKSELLGLQWQALDGTSLCVEPQLLGMKEDDTMGAVSLETSLPKGKRARSFDLSEKTVVLLREHKRQQAELKLKNRLQYKDDGLVFAQAWEQKHGEHSGLGWPLNKSSVEKQLDRLCRAARAKRITIHGLGHMCATLLLSAGVPAHVVQMYSGAR